MALFRAALNVTVAAASMAVAACASRGNEVLKTQDVSSIDLAIVDGRTTRDDVVRTFGAPEHTTFLSAKNEVWTYRWSRATNQGQNFIPIVGAFVRGYDVRKKELTIVFDERNVVARHTMTDINDQIKTGLMSSSSAGALADKGSVSASVVSGAGEALPEPRASPAPRPAPPPAAAAPAAAEPAGAKTGDGWQSRFRL